MNTELIYDTYAPTEKPELEIIMNMFNIQPGETFCDLGSGKGDVLIKAAQLGAQCYGYEIDTDLINESNNKINEFELTNNINILNQDFYNQDISNYNLIYVNLSEEAVIILLDKLLEAGEKGARIIMNMGMEGFRRCRQCNRVIYNEEIFNIKTVRFELSNIPWFINTPGYETNDLGPYTHILMTINI